MRNRKYYRWAYIQMKIRGSGKIANNEYDMGTSEGNFKTALGSTSIDDAPYVFAEHVIHWHVSLCALKACLYAPASVIRQ